jgi:hypothetical protein
MTNSPLNCANQLLLHSEYDLNLTRIKFLLEFDDQAITK